MKLPAAGFAAVVALAACHRSSAPDGPPAPVASGAAARAPAPPPDHLAPGELFEGTDKAFDVTLPRGLRTDAAFSSVVYTSGALDLHALTTYFGARLQGGDLREGATSATFDRVTAKDKPGRLLNIHIATTTGQGVHVDIRDVTPLPGPPLLDNEARWKRVGLTPSGRLIDPTHLD
jgi:hypothetical protein